MNISILGLENNQLLEVHERKTGVADKVRALAAIQVRVDLVLVQIDGYTQISDGFLEHTETGVAPSSRQVVQRTCLIGLFYDALKVTNCVVEAMQSKVKDTTQEKHLLVFRAVLQRSRQVFLGIFKHLVLSLWLDRLVHRVLHDGHGSHQVRVALSRLHLSGSREERDGLLIVR